MPDEKPNPPDEAEAAAAAPDAEASEEAAPDAVFFLDPRVGEEEARLLGEALGWRVEVLDPIRLDPAALAARAVAAVVPWQCGVQCGVDVVESLRGCEATRELPLVVVSDAPTARRVGAALRAGATSFAWLPYDGAELRQRLGDLDGAGDSEAPPAG